MSTEPSSDRDPRDIPEYAGMTPEAAAAADRQFGKIRKLAEDETARLLQSEPFSPEQTTRAEALRVSRDVMLARGSVFGGSKVELAVAEVVDLAMYIVDGTHPLERYDEPAELRVRSLQGEEIVVDTEA